MPAGQVVDSVTAGYAVDSLMALLTVDRASAAVRMPTDSLVD